MMRPEDRYDDLVDELVGSAGVTPPRGGGGFGRTAIRFQNKIFAMLVRGRLVLKLPAERVDALIGAGDGVRFDANKGTPMKEWFSLDPESGRAWRSSPARPWISPAPVADAAAGVRRSAGRRTPFRRRRRTSVRASRSGAAFSSAGFSPALAGRLTGS